MEEISMLAVNSCQNMAEHMAFPCGKQPVVDMQMTFAYTDIKLKYRIHEAISKCNKRQALHTDFG